MPARKRRPARGRSAAGSPGWHWRPDRAGGIYLNGNRTSDAYALNGPGSTACTGSASTCTATYTYDARDRLVSATDGHGGTTTYAFDQNNSADSSIRAGNITTQTSPAGTTTSTYNGDQLTSATTGGVTTKYWYDGLGRLTCVTTAAGTAASCDTIATGNTNVSAAVITASSYDFMDRFTATHAYSNGTPVSSAAYSYDALDRTAAETETHNAANLQRTTTFSYEGLTNLATQEVQANTGATTSTDTKTYDYDVYGTRISLGDSTVSGGTTTTGNFLYGYNTHGDVSLLTDQSNGSVRAAYGYIPYGAPDTTLSKGDSSLTTPFNPYQYSAKRFDSGSATYDMGVRRYDPSAQRFLQLDQFQGALADLALATDPLTQDRYDLAASNPLSAIEWDGHVATLAAGGGGGPSPNPWAGHTILGVSSQPGRYSWILSVFGSIGAYHPLPAQYCGGSNFGMSTCLMGRSFLSLSLKYGRQAGVDPALVLGIAFTESSGRSDVTTPAGNETLNLIGMELTKQACNRQ